MTHGGAQFYRQNRPLSCEVPLTSGEFHSIEIIVNRVERQRQQLKESNWQNLPTPSKRLV
jgi:hypothetical protein